MLKCITNELTHVIFKKISFKFKRLETIPNHRFIRQLENPNKGSFLLCAVSQMKMWKSKWGCLEQLVNTIKRRKKHVKDEEMFILIEINV